MRNFTFIQNQTSITDFLSYDNSITSMKMGNTIIPGNLMWGIMIIVWMVVFMVYRNHPKQNAYAIASFSMLMTTMLFVPSGIVVQAHFAVALAIFIVSIVYLYTRSPDS